MKKPLQALLAVTALSLQAGACCYADSDVPLELFIRGVQGPYEGLGREHHLSRQELEEAPLPALDDVLRRVPGFTLFRRSSSLASHPTTQGVSLRGTGPSGASRTLVLLDGVPLNDPFGGWVNWNRLPSLILEDVRLQQGFGPRHWSNVSLGSLIDVQTRAAGEGSSEATATIGNRDTYGFGGLVSTTAGRLSGQLATEGSTTGGYEIVERGDRGRIDEDASSEHLNVSGKLGYRTAPGTEVYGAMYLFDEKRENGTPLTDNETSSITISSGVQHERGAERMRLQVFGTAQEFESRFSSQSRDRNDELPALDQFDVPSSQLGMALSYAGEGGKGRTWETGIDTLWRTGETNEDFRFMDGKFTMRRRAEGSQLGSGAYYFRHEPISSSSSVKMFLRAGGWRDDGFSREETSLETLEVERRESFDRGTDFELEPRLQFEWRAGTPDIVRASVSRAVRQPTINELVRPFRVRNDITEANPDLRPERAWLFDIAVEQQIGKATVILDGFLTLTDNTIVNQTVGNGPGTVAPCGFVPEGGVCRQRGNVDEARVYGFEAELSHPLSETVSMNAAYLYQESEITDANGSALEDKSLAQLPRHQAWLGSKLTRGMFTGTLSGRFSGTQFEDDLNTLKLDSFVTIDASILARVSRGLELFVSLQNLTGNRYEVGKTSEGLETVGPPFLVFGGVRAKF